MKLGPVSPDAYGYRSQKVRMERLSLCLTKYHAMKTYGGLDV
jgi:hypothetical protein